MGPGRSSDGFVGRSVHLPAAWPFDPVGQEPGHGVSMEVLVLCKHLIQQWRVFNI